MAELAELSKTELIDRVERARALARRVRDAHTKESLVWKAVGVLASNAGGAVAAVSDVVSHKYLKPNIAGKVPWLMAALNDLASLFFEGEAGRAFDAWSHGYQGYLTGDATRHALTGGVPHK